MTCALAISLAVTVHFLIVKQKKTNKTINRYFRVFRRRDSQMDEIIDQVVGIVRELLEMAATSSVTQDLFMHRLSRHLFLHPKNPKSLIRHLDKLADFRYYGVITFLSENNYRLTQDDLILCSMICFDFSQAVISMLYGYSGNQSYYNRRNRLREKLGISKDGEHIRTYLMRLTQRLSPEKL